MKKYIPVLAIILLLLSGCGKEKESDVIFEYGSDTNAQQSNAEVLIDEKGNEVIYQNDSASGAVYPDSFSLGKIYRVKEDLRTSITGVELNGDKGGSANDGLVNNIGIKNEGIRSVFELNENISMKIQYTGGGIFGNGIKYAISPHKQIQEYNSEIINSIPDGYKGSVSNDEVIFNIASDQYNPGYYDILFLYDGNIIDYVTIKLFKEGFLADSSSEEINEMMIDINDLL